MVHRTTSPPLVLAPQPSSTTTPRRNFSHRARHHCGINPEQREYYVLPRPAKNFKPSPQANLPSPRVFDRFIGYSPVRIFFFFFLPFGYIYIFSYFLGTFPRVFYFRAWFFSVRFFVYFRFVEDHVLNIFHVKLLLLFLSFCLLL